MLGLSATSRVLPKRTHLPDWVLVLKHCGEVAGLILGNDTAEL